MNGDGKKHCYCNAVKDQWRNTEVFVIFLRFFFFFIIRFFSLFCLVRKDFGKISRDFTDDLLPGFLDSGFDVLMMMIWDVLWHDESEALLDEAFEAVALPS